MEVIPSVPLALALAMPFLVTFVALYAILYRPLVAYLAERDGAIHGAREEASSLDAQRVGQLEQLNARLAKTREEIAVFRGEARARAHTAATAVLAEARAHAEERVKSAVRQIESERVGATSTLRSTAGELSRDITRQILGREVQA
jgi:F0F1-type ATP synthase membrane subunit b/b'